jgi:hypothetical protein
MSVSVEEASDSSLGGPAGVVVVLVVLMGATERAGGRVDAVETAAGCGAAMTGTTMGMGAGCIAMAAGRATVMGAGC